MKPGTRVLDYGCGLGYLYEYLQKSGCEISYTGVDILPEFVNACNQKFPDADFRNGEGDSDVIGEFDVVFASGVFNICTHNDPVESRAYALARVEQLFGWAKEVLVCDFLSSYVDFQQSDAQHFSVGEIADFSVARLGRRFLLRHDVLPYEMTLVAWSNSSITRPGNFYEVDK